MGKSEWRSILMLAPRRECENTTSTRDGSVRDTFVEGVSKPVRKAWNCANVSGQRTRPGGPNAALIGNGSTSSPDEKAGCAFEVAHYSVQNSFAERAGKALLRTKQD